jgi:hypothetical protein
LSRSLDACRANLRVCDHLLHEYNADLLDSAPFQRRRHDEQTLVKFCKKYGYLARDTYGNASAAGQFVKSLRAYCGHLSYEKVAKIITNVQILHFPDDVRHNIICIILTEVGLKYTFDFASEYVYHCVLETRRLLLQNSIDCSSETRLRQGTSRAWYSRRWWILRHHSTGGFIGPIVYPLEDAPDPL